MKNKSNYLEMNSKFYFLLCLIVPIFVFAYMFLPYILFGENCIITIHDNLDSNIAWFKYVRDNHLLFKLNIPSTVLNGLSTLYFGGGFQLQNIIHYIFPPFAAYTINFILFTLIGFFAMYYLQKLIFGDNYKLTLIFTSLMFACLPCFPGYRMDISAIPLAVLLFYHIFKNTKKYLWCLAFFYPFISSFGGTEMFLCGFWLLGVIVVSIKQKKIHWQLFWGFILLCFGTVVFNFRLFYMRFAVHEPLNRDFFTIAPSNFFVSLKHYFFVGYYHAASLQGKILLPFSMLSIFCSLVILFYDSDFSIKESLKRIPRELILMIACVILIVSFSLISALADAGIIVKILKFICPPLAGFSFARFFLFNCVLWYILFTCAVIYCYREKFSRIFAIICILAQLALVCSQKGFYADSAKSWKKNIVGASYNISYKHFYSTELFETIKNEIAYSGESVCAFGYHPAVLMYNGFNCIDGYISVYPYKDMVLWHNLMSPEFEHNKTDRSYFDSWGGRRYIYNENLSFQPTTEKKHEPVNFDVDMEILRNDFKCHYILSRAEIANAKEQNLKLKGIFDSDKSLYKIFVYEL